MKPFVVRTALSALFLALAGSVASAQDFSTATRQASTHFIVVVDRSTSITTAETAGYAKLVKQLIQALSFGDRLTMFVAFEQGRRHGTIERSREMPPVRNPASPLPTEQAALESARASLRATTSVLFQAPATGWTDLLTSLRQAGEQYDSTGARRRVLIVLSDMLHCVPHSLCLDRSDFKGVGARWFANERANGALASLHDVCVTVVGAEQANGRDAHVREFWRTYFEAAGANLAPERYRYAPETVTSRDCGTSQQLATR